MTKGELSEIYYKQLNGRNKYFITSRLNYTTIAKFEKDLRENPMDKLTVEQVHHVRDILEKQSRDNMLCATPIRSNSDPLKQLLELSHTLAVEDLKELKASLQSMISMLDSKLEVLDKLDN